MKKLVSLLLVVTMIASLSLVAFADVTENIMKTTITETADGINVVVSISNPNNFSGGLASLVFPAALSVDKTAYTLGDNFTKLTVAPASKSGQVKYTFSFGAESDFVTATGDVVVLSYKLTRDSGNDAVYTSSDFKYGTGLYKGQVTYKSGTTSITKNSTDSASADYFSAPVYTDARVPATTDKWEAQDTAPTGWTNPATEGATSVVVFGKNATAKTLADGDYKVKFGDNEYEGKASSGDVSYWAIVIYDATANGQYITAGNEYTGNVTCGTDTWNVKVTPVAGQSTAATKVAD